MAARYRDIKPGECFAVLDGDQNKNSSTLIHSFIGDIGSHTTSNDPEYWFISRLEFLPGDTWPEKWLLENIDVVGQKILSDLFSIDIPRLISYIEDSLRSGKHSEIYTLTQHLNSAKEHVLRCLARVVCKNKETSFDSLIKTLTGLLD